MIPDEDLPRLLRGALSLLFLSPYEGFGIPALEAMAAGIPAVVSNTASLPEVVGDAGIVVDPEATDAIVDILINLEDNSRLREDYGQKGRQRATQYTWSQCVDRLMNAFKQLHNSIKNENVLCSQKQRHNIPNLAVDVVL
jgi:glycosyltransferase involved in cell wall biosynthesis